MSDIPSSPGVRSRGPDLDLPPASPGSAYTQAPPEPAPRSESASSGSSTEGQAKQVAQAGTEAARQAAGEVKDTAKDQAQRVAAEATAQTRNLASEVRDRLGEQARSQNDRLVGTIRQTADQLDEMRGDRADSPAATVVSRVADSGRQFADYLDRHGPEGVLQEVQDFARRRPGAFLAAALAAGFVVGRLGKSVTKADDHSGQAKPTSDTFTSRSGNTAGYAPGYPSAPTPSEYAATGTGVPVAVTEDYGSEAYPGGVR
ncbi:hypothetical protein [Krasilnikovia sp. MM14-A1004]|uniref:hypothetical protein n=1 Tax=Krasilnikovia sp. MM14-A1004 TaxID=3373541 RepID=UPI00399C74B8